MKPIHIALPAAAVLINCGYLYLQSSSADVLRREVANMRQVIDAATTQSADAGRDADTVDRAEGAAGGRPESEAPDTGAKKIDLQEVVELIRNARGSRMPDLRGLMQFQRALLEMSPEEVRDLLVQARELDVPDAARAEVLGLLAERLAEHDPAGAVGLLTADGGAIEEAMKENWWRLRNVFNRWVEKDLDRAMQWLDERAAAGDFELRSLDDSNQARVSLEVTVISELLKRDAELARQRMDSLTDAERRAVLYHPTGDAGDPEARREWVALMRDYLPEGQRDWSALISGIPQDGKLEKVAGFMDEIDATPVERRAMAQAAVGEVLNSLTKSGTATPDKAAEIRTWLAETVDQPDTVLGEALAGWWQSDVDRITEVVAALHAASPSDDLLATYIDRMSGRRGARESLRGLAEKISDPERRNALLEKIQ